MVPPRQGSVSRSVAFLHNQSFRICIQRKALDALRPTFRSVFGNAHLGDSSLLGIKERVTINKGETS